MIDLLVGADDRTGALEAAGASADAGTGPVWVGSSAAGATGSVAVVDLGSRHLAPAEAAARAATLDAVDHRAAAHKIDSLLRGNWAHELVARQASGRRVLVVPALPSAGRACVAGVVVEDGRPVGQGAASTDPRHPGGSSRPADHLREAGASAVTELAGVEALAAWLAGSDGASFAVCDAVTEVDLAAIAAAWSGRTDVLIAGTAATVAAAAASLTTGLAAGPPALAPAILVVCGSLHAMARRQVAHLGALGVAVAEPGSFLGTVTDSLRIGRPAAVVSPLSREPLVPAPAALEMAEQLATTARELAAAVAVGTLVVVGGDTAASVLGPEPLMVGGTLAPGTPWARRVDGDGPIIVTRAGSFGTRSSLAELVWGRLGT
jgi:4-hydroxythreonine-4-phosphate dehydrogenase